MPAASSPFLLFLLLFVVTVSTAHRYGQNTYNGQPQYQHQLPRSVAASFNGPREPRQNWTFLYREPELTLDDMIAKEPRDTFQIVYELMARVFGSTYSHFIAQFSLELIVAEKQSNRNSNRFLSDANIAKHALNEHPFWSLSLNLDVLEVDNNGTNGIILRGSSTLALIAAFNWYLQDWCNTTYDWRTYSLDLPTQLPMPMKTRRQRSVPFTYYENVCTVSYTQAFWSWTEWETHLDWMAMQGINLPLAFAGQEYVWSKTFTQFNFTQDDLEAFFSGPGFFAWQRMGNLRGWAGPLTQAAILDQYNMQIQILARMNSFGMIPALTAFAGHVPYAITKYYPNANVEPSPNWWGSPAEWCCDLLLNFTDPLFQQIGSAFIEQQTKYFGTGHVYQCDSFNEMDPPTTSATYLRAASSKIYEAMNTVDENAVWLMQGWLFESGFWKPPEVEAYVNGVPNDGLMILDLYSEVSPQYNKYESFYGHPFVWNTLHNFGGNQGLLGTLYSIAVGLPAAFVFPQSTVMGVGITMEGINQNYVIYDLTLSMAYETHNVDVDAFVQQYSLRRYGLPHSISSSSSEQSRVVTAMNKAWQILQTSVYNISHWGGVTKNLMCVAPALNAVRSGFMPTKLLYDPVVIQQTWQLFASVTNVSDLVALQKYRYDLIDVTRQALSDLFEVNYVHLNASYYEQDVAAAQKYGQVLMELMADLDRLLNTNANWMLGPWIAMATAHSSVAAEQNWWQWNARNQVTLWGPDGEISNYASKQWGGLLSSYHAPQWRLFVSQVVAALQSGQAFNQGAFNKQNMDTLEQPWQTALDVFPVTPLNDTIVVVCDLYRKWNTLNDRTTCA